MSDLVGNTKTGFLTSRLVCLSKLNLKTCIAFFEQNESQGKAEMRYL